MVASLEGEKMQVGSVIAFASSRRSMTLARCAAIGAGADRSERELPIAEYVECLRSGRERPAFAGLS